MNVNKYYLLIILSFVFSQLAPALIAPLLLTMGFEGNETELFATAIAYSMTIGFILAVLFSSLAGRDPQFDGKRADTGKTILWSFIGIFLAFAGQYAASLIQMLAFGIEPGSENTEMIVGFSTAVPFMIFVVAILVPVTEELVFRKVIFGAIYKRTGFWIAAIVSGLIFGALHGDFENILVYLAMGVVFSYLYVKTGRIIVPIIAHVGINSFVMLVQVVFGDRLLELIDQLEEMEQSIQALMGVFLS